MQNIPTYRRNWTPPTVNGGSSHSFSRRNCPCDGSSSFNEPLGPLFPEELTLITAREGLRVSGVAGPRTPTELDLALEGEINPPLSLSGIGSEKFALLAQPKGKQRPTQKGTSSMIYTSQVFSSFPLDAWILVHAVILWDQKYPSFCRSRHGRRVTIPCSIMGGDPERGISVLIGSLVLGVLYSR